MLLITVISLFFIFIIFGFGLFIKRLIPIIFGNHLNWFDPFWIGFAFLIGFLQFWHFIQPISWIILLIVVLLSVYGWYVYKKLIIQSLSSKTIWIMAGMIVIILLFVQHVIFSLPSYDHGLYHLQTVKWFNQFAIVPGLGNLQHRLAFNSSNYLYAAFINTGLFHGYSYYVSSVILVVMITLKSGISYYKWLTHPDISLKPTIYYVILLPVILWHASNQPLAGYPADMTIFAIQIIIFGKIVSLMEEKQDLTRYQSLFLQVLVLSAAATTIKLSFLAFGALAVILVFFLGYFRFDRMVFLKEKFPSILAAVSFWGIPWLIRNLILSGYLLYPSKIIHFPFLWKMPPYLINDIQAGISTWARTNAGNLVYTGDLSWFIQWLKQFVFEPRSIFFLTVILLAVLILLSLFKGSQKIDFKFYLLLLFLIVPSLMIWFFSAPTYRFSGALFWLFFVVVIFGLVDWLALNRSQNTTRVAVFTVFVFLFFFLQNDFSRNFSFSKLLVVENELATAQRQQPLEVRVVKKTTSGLEINVPAEGELCWNLPLPCTTPNDFLPTLTLIDPQDMGKGFFISPKD